MRDEVVSVGAVNSGEIVKPVKSMMPSCSALKVAYSDCFNRWYTDKFVTNRWEKGECFFEMEAYRACIMRRMDDRKVMEFRSNTQSFHPEDGR